MRLLPGAALLGLALTACDRTAEPVAEHMRRGDAALAAGRYGRALSAYTHARELGPTDPAVQRALMRARVHAYADSPTRLSGEALDDAQYEAQLMLDTDKPHEAVYQTALGNILARQGDLEGAKARYADALRADPNCAVAHTALAVALMAHKEGIPQAKSELEAALRAKPEHTGALVTLGQIKLAEGDLPGAADRFEAALKVADEFGTRMALGGVRIQQQKPADAVPHFQRAAQLDPRSVEALGSLGQALLSTGHPDEAERALRAAAQIHHDEANDIALGFALNEQRKPDQALAVFAQILAQDPASGTALFGAATASEALGKNEQAFDLYRRLVALPAEGPQKAVTVNLQKEAAARLKAMAPPAASASPAASGAPAAGPPAPAGRADPLGARR